MLFCPIQIISRLTMTLVLHAQSGVIVEYGFAENINPETENRTEQWLNPTHQRPLSDVIFKNPESKVFSLPITMQVPSMKRAFYHAEKCNLEVEIVSLE